MGRHGRRDRILGRVAERDLAAAKTLLDSGDTANALLLCQQSLEKALKGILQLQSPDPPPRIHNLVRLLELAGLMLYVPEAMLDTLVEVAPYIIESRYPSTIGEGTPVPPNPDIAAELVTRTEEALTWLLARLKS